MQNPIIVRDKSCDKVNSEHRSKYSVRLLSEGKFLVVWFGGGFASLFFSKAFRKHVLFWREEKKEHSITVALVVGVSDACISSVRYF